MATFFSEQFSSDGNNKTSFDAKIRAVGHSRIRHKRGKIILPAGGAAANDVLRFFSLKSSDRLLELYLSATSAMSTGTLNLGLHKAGDEHDGAVLDAALFASVVDLATAALARVEEFKESAALTDHDRGNQLWQFVGQASDPKETWDLTGTVGTAINAGDTITVEAFYISGD